MGRAKNSPQNIEIIRKTLLAEGLPPIAVAATLGRMAAESRFDPNAINPNDGADGSDSIGLNQWNGKRAQNLKAFAAERGTSVSDVATQAAFYAAEVKGQYGGAEAKYGQKLLAAETPEQAAAATISLARPKGWTAANPAGGLGYSQTLADTKRFASGDFSYQGSRGKTLTGATAADFSYLPPDSRGLMQGSKSAGRTAEEGDVPLTVPDLASFGSDLTQPQGQAEIDNTPGGKIGQAIMGLLGTAAKFQEDSKKMNPGGNLFSQKALSSSESLSSPSAHSIVAMIQNMGR